ncbi:MAG TPA: outer membrane beta-barrel protein [Gammaproteobacteria bacterium]|nr:outer membrane beta-barrel protein [Gammaproteobacteria bacterium]
MSKRTSLLIVILAAAAPFAAQAAEPDQFRYTYVEGGYLSENPSGGGSDLTGVLVDGSYELQPNWRISGLFSNASCCGITDNRYAAAVGYFTGINDKIDFIADLSFLDQHVTNNGSHSGWGVDGGLRFMVAPKFELDGLVQHSSINGTTENTLTAKGLFSLADQWRLYASYSNNSAENDFQLGVRYVF